MTAAVNMVCYRGPVRHAPHVPWLTRPAYGPTRFFYFNLFESDVTGSPLAVRTRARGSVDEYARVVGRWLVTRDGFDFLVFYLPDYDYASHAAGPEVAHAALAHADRAIATLFEAAGGPEEFLERYAVLLCSDHGQTRVDRAVRLEDAFEGLTLFHRGNGRAAELAVTASNRAGMVYRLPGCRDDPRELAERLDGGSHVVLFHEDGAVVARKDGDELRFAPSAERLADERRRRGARAARCARAGLGRARQPERRRPRRLRRPRGRVRGSRRTPSRRRRKPRLAGDGRLRGPDALDRSRRASGEDVDVTPRVLDYFGVSHER